MPAMITKQAIFLGLCGAHLTAAMNESHNSQEENNSSHSKQESSDSLSVGDGSAERKMLRGNTEKKHIRKLNLSDEVQKEDDASSSLKSLQSSPDAELFGDNMSPISGGSAHQGAPQQQASLQHVNSSADATTEYDANSMVSNRYSYQNSNQSHTTISLQIPNGPGQQWQLVLLAVLDDSINNVYNQMSQSGNITSGEDESLPPMNNRQIMQFLMDSLPDESIQEEHKSEDSVPSQTSLPTLSSPDAFAQQPQAVGTHQMLDLRMQLLRLPEPTEGSEASQDEDTLYDQMGVALGMGESRGNLLRGLRQVALFQRESVSDDRSLEGFSREMSIRDGASEPTTVQGPGPVMASVVKRRNFEPMMDSSISSIHESTLQTISSVGTISSGVLRLRQQGFQGNLDNRQVAPENDFLLQIQQQWQNAVDSVQVSVDNADNVEIVYIVLPSAGNFAELLRAQEEETLRILPTEGNFDQLLAGKDNLESLRK